MTSRDYFRGKRVAIIGLGPHGEMVADARFLIKAEALVSVYDIRSEARVKNHIVFLRSVGLANYVCGSIPPDDLMDMDLIILSHEYSRESSFLKTVKEKGITIEYPETLFFKLSPPVNLVGVMGSCGKATVVSMLAPMLAEICVETNARGSDNQSLFVLDPESADGILAHLKKVKSGDIVLIRITESMMRELRNIRISPHVAIFTTIPPKNAYDDSPFEILGSQTYNNFIIASDEVIDATRLYKFQTKAKMLRTKPGIIPSDWEFKGRSHDRDNAALAIQAAQLFKVPEDAIRIILEGWKPLKGRLEFIKKVKNVEFYNDTASISPRSTMAGIVSLSSDRNLILILGGADTSYDYKELYDVLPHYVRAIVLVPGSGTLKERPSLQKIDKVNLRSVSSVEEAVRTALEIATKGDCVLFSPGFAACGLDASRKERGERFVRAVRGL